MDIPCQLIAHPSSSEKDKILINIWKDVTLKSIANIMTQHYLMEKSSLSFNIDFTTNAKFKGTSSQSVSYADYSKEEDDVMFDEIRKENLANGTWVDFIEANISSINLEYGDIFDCTGYIGYDFMEYHLHFLPENSVPLASMNETSVYSLPGI